MSEKLFKTASIYIVVEFLNKSVPFILLPILTRYLTPSEYGLLSLFTVYIYVLVILCSLGLSSSISVNYHQLHKSSISIYNSTSFIIILLTWGILLLITVFFEKVLVELTGIPFFWLIMAYPIVLTTIYFLNYMNLLQMKMKPMRFSFFQLTKSFLEGGLSVVFVVILLRSWVGRLEAMLIVSIIFFFVIIYFMVKDKLLPKRICFSKKYAKDGLSFGLPLVPHQISYWVKTGLDRYLIAFLLTQQAVGIYSAGYQVGFSIFILVSAVNQAMIPYLYEKLKNKDEIDKYKLVSLTYKYFLVLIVLGILMSTFIPKILTLFLGKNYAEATEIIPYLVFSAVIHGMYLMVLNYIFYFKESKKLALITFSTGLIHVFLSYQFIKLYGIQGAAIASLFSYIITFLLTWRLSNKVFPLPWFDSFKIK
ncbi:lipopolysaccharide biosynthesis protein [Thalassobellus sediminis]|uniref:lipopolysaccharide biosynthesis protein n=1 Tax=Thalassobellus sediminis TaxID=3367753 RepID=UPI00379D537E